MELHSERIHCGNRTYFFDIKKSNQGDYYIVISENKKIDEDKYEKHRVMVFEEDLKRFVDAFKQTLIKLKEIKQPGSNQDNRQDSKAYKVDKIRENYPNAYKPWTPELDERLEILFCEGKTIGDLVKIFGRDAGAIHSRISKLEIREKYNKKS